MRGVPNHPVACSRCGDPHGYPKDGLCFRCRRVRPGFNPRVKYRWTPEQEQRLRAIYVDASNKRALSRGITDLMRRTGFPRHIITLKAQAIGLTLDLRRPWTPQDLAVLQEWTGALSARAIGKRLGRSYYSVRSKMQEAGLSGRYRGSQPTEGYSQSEFAQVMGVSQRQVARWIDRGLLRLGGRNCGESRISDSQAWNFVRNHSELYDLRRVDQPWFKSIAFGVRSLEIVEPRRPAAADGAPSALDEVSYA